MPDDRLPYVHAEFNIEAIKALIVNSSLTCITLNGKIDITITGQDIEDQIFAWLVERKENKLKQGN